MKTSIVIMTITAFIFAAVPAVAMQGHDSKNMSEHDKGDMGFKHDAVVDGMRSEFQIMSLESMKMTDDKGRTHHIMVKLFDEKTKAEIKNAVGKIKIIAPDGSEQVSTLKNYSGIFAANFTFADKGKYGVICLLKVQDQKRVVKFWYNHHG